MIKYTDSPFIFDSQSLHADMVAFCKLEDVTMTDIAAMLGCSGALLSSFKKAGVSTRTDTVLGICNLLGFNPRKYFVLNVDEQAVS